MPGAKFGQLLLPEIFAQTGEPGLRSAEVAPAGDLSAVDVLGLDQFLLLEYLRQVLEGHSQRIKASGASSLSHLSAAFDRSLSLSWASLLVSAWRFYSLRCLVIGWVADPVILCTGGVENCHLI
jgi:hypothetical protein